MKKYSEFWSLIVFVGFLSVVSSQIIIPVIHPKSGGKEVKCNLSDAAVADYHKVENFILDFLYTTEVNFFVTDDIQRRFECVDWKKNLSQLIEQGKKDWANCLTNEFKYFGDFVNETLQNFLDYFCEGDRRHIEDYFTANAQQCRNDITKPLLLQCIASMSDKKNTLDDLNSFGLSVPSKKDKFCRSIIDMRPCISELLQQHCPRLKSYHQLSLELFDKTIGTCDEYRSYLYASRIVGITLLVICALIIIILRFFNVKKLYEDLRHRSDSKPLTSIAT